MKTMQLQYSSTADKPMIHINDLESLKQHLTVKLGLSDEEFDQHVLLDWTDSNNEATRRHCVNPLVHVLVSRKATQLIADRTHFLPYMFSMQSTPRNMDWMIVFYPDAFDRIQEYAFTESRKLLRLEKENAALDTLKTERYKFVPLEGVPADYILAFEVGGSPEPLPLGEPQVPGQYLKLVRGGAVKYVRVPNALWRYDVPTGVADPEAAPELPTHVREALAHIADRLRCVRYRIFYEEGKGLVKILDAADNMLSLTQGVGKDIADVIKAADIRRRKIVEVVPVGTKLKAEFYDLARFITTHRPERGMVDIPTQVRLGNTEAYHYPPYCSQVRHALEQRHLLEYSLECGLVIITLNDDFKSLVAVADINGMEISTSNGMGNDIALAFGGKIGRNIGQ